MMKKAIKKLLAALLAVAMVCAMAIPAFAYDTEEDLNESHSYIAFQIFKGDVFKLFILLIFSSYFELYVQSAC